MALQRQAPKNVRNASWMFGHPVLRAENNGYARWHIATSSPYNQKGGGWLAELYGGTQSGNDDWAGLYIPVNEISVPHFEAAQWSWYQTNTETMGVNMVIWMHDPANFDNRAEVTQLANHSGLDKTSGWNSHEFDQTVTQMFFYGENTTGTGLTAGTQYPWTSFKTDDLFKDWTIYRISFEFGWDASGTFESAYVAEVKLNEVPVPLKPDTPDLLGLPCSGWVTSTVAKDGTISATGTDLGMPYKYCTVILPTIDSAAISLQGAMTLDGTYNPIHGWNDADADGTVLVATTAGTGVITATFPLGGFQYVKVLCGAAQTTAAVTFYLRGFN